MKIVIDTNVFVSAFLSPGGIPAGILNMFINEKFILLYDNRIISEYGDVLSRDKFCFPGELVETFIEYIRFKGEYVVADPAQDLMADNDDRMFLEVARSGSASYLVTGNRSHFPDEKLIVSPKEFLMCAKIFGKV